MLNVGPELLGKEMTGITTGPIVINESGDRIRNAEGAML
jgi:hypothetical protein